MMGKERSGLSDRVHLRDANLARDQECYLTKERKEGKSAVGRENAQAALRAFNTI